MSYKAVVPWVRHYDQRMLTHGFPMQIDPDVPVSCWCVTNHSRLSALELPLISSRGVTDELHGQLLCPQPVGWEFSPGENEPPHLSGFLAECT